MDTLRQDLRFAFRTLVRRPVFALVAILSLALGIGVNSALFSVVNVLVLRPVPGVEGYERVVELGRDSRGGGFDTFAWPDFQDIRSEVGALEEVAGYRFASFSFDTGEGGARLSGQFVTPSYFDALGLRPARGRFFGAEAATGFGEHPVAVVSHDFWQGRLGGDAEAVGSTIRLNRMPFTVVGVTPEAFRGHTVGISQDVFVPMTMAPALEAVSRETFDSRRSSWLQALGRLAPGATVGEADAQVEALFQRLQEAHPDSNRDRTASVIPLGPVPGGGRAAVVGFLGALAALALLVLLVTCANVAGMFLARASAREREIAIRLAVGSGRGRLVRQLLTESLLVFILGGTLGAAVAFWAMGLVDIGALPVPVDLSLDLSPDLRVLSLAMAVTLGTGVLFGLFPALRATRSEIVSTLKDDAGGGRVGRSLMRRVFVSTQVGLSLVLLVAAGLFLRALQRTAHVDTGFDPENVYVTDLDLDLEGYDREGGEVFASTLRGRLEDIPGVTVAALSLDLPMDLGSHGTGVWPEGWTGPDGGESLGVDFNVVTPGYFRALEMELVRGRGFESTDRSGSEEVAVVSTTFVERAWPGENPLGRRLRFGSDEGPWVTVVGVVEDVKNQTVMDEAAPFVYRPLHQDFRSQLGVLVESPRPHAEVAEVVRATILDVDPGISLTPVHTLEGVTSVGVLPQRIAASVATSLALLALLLSGIGLYGVVAYAVAQRTREIGIRMALGAGSGRVLRHVLGGSLLLTLPGLAVGAVLAGVLARLLQAGGFLLGVDAFDPLALAGVAALLTAVVAVATLIPARRAAGVEPSRALRYE